MLLAHSSRLLCLNILYTLRSILITYILHTYVHVLTEGLKDMMNKPNTDVNLSSTGGDITQSDESVAIPRNIESKISSSDQGTYMCLYNN